MEFSQIVLRHVSRIPHGQVMTYKELAFAVGYPRAWRAIGNILHNNPRPLEVPCHRVVKSDGRVGGYVHGVKKKIALLKREGVRIRKGKVLNRQLT